MFVSLEWTFRAVVDVERYLGHLAHGLALGQQRSASRGLRTTCSGVCLLPYQVDRFAGVRLVASIA
ncbi:MAG: hypothetical protein ACR2GX_05155 [Candidatus Dormibacteria bacterium]